MYFNHFKIFLQRLIFYYYYLHLIKSDFFKHHLLILVQKLNKYYSKMLNFDQWFCFNAHLHLNNYDDYYLYFVIQKKSFNFLIRLYNIHLISLMLKYGSSILNYFKNWRTYSKKIWMMKSKLWLMLKLNKNKNKFLKEQLKMLGLLIWIVFKFGLNILILKPWEIIWNSLILFLTWLFKLPWKTALLFLISKYCIYV